MFCILLQIKAIIVTDEAGKLKKGANSETYRNSLKCFIELLKRIKEEKLLKKQHHPYLQRFPLYNFINMLYDGVISENETTKNSTCIDLVIRSYKRHLKCFQIGEVKIPFTVDDIGNLFGISTEGQDVKVSGHIKKKDKDDVEYSSFMSRHFNGHANVTKQRIEEQIFVAIKGTTNEEREDTAKLIFLYLVATFLVSNSNSTVSSNLVPYCICNEKISSISWPKTMHKHLMDQVEKYAENPRKITACVTLLLVLHFN